MEITILLYHRWHTSVNRERNILKISQSAKWQTRDASHKSLDKFVAKFPSYVAKPYLLWMKDRKTQAGVEYLPIYMAPCLAES